MVKRFITLVVVLLLSMPLMAQDDSVTRMKSSVFQHSLFCMAVRGPQMCCSAWFSLDTMDICDSVLISSASNPCAKRLKIKLKDCHWNPHIF